MAFLFPLYQYYYSNRIWQDIQRDNPQEMENSQQQASETEPPKMDGISDGNSREAEQQPAIRFVYYADEQLNMVAIRSSGIRPGTPLDAQEVAREFLSLWAPDKWDSVSFRTLLPPFDCDEPPVYRKIGSNLFADMFDHMGSGNMVKVASTQGWAQWLWSEFLCHHRVYTAFSTNDAICQVPRIYKYVTGDRTEWWDRNGLLICDPGDSPPQSRAALITQRIVQVPKVARQALVRLFWPQKSTKSALSNLSSHDCLMHIHLGKGGPLFPAADSFMISPRNLTLNLNQICWLGLPILDYSGAIGEALALMHWSVRVDGNCVKFVLGSEAHSIKPVEYGPQSLLRSMTLRLFISWSR